MAEQEMMVINWLLCHLQKNGLISRNTVDIALAKYKKKYVEDLYETVDDDYKKAA